MIEFKPGDVWRRETKADTELVILREQRIASSWQVVHVSIGRVSGWSCTVERTVSEEWLIEEWMPLAPDPEFYLRRAAQTARRMLDRFTEECDPWMTPRPDRAEYETRPAPRKKVLILARTYQLAKEVARERGLTGAEWRPISATTASRGHSPETWDLAVHESAWDLPATRKAIEHLRASGFEVPERG